MVPHDVIETGQQAEAGADLHVHGSVHVVEEVQRLVDQLAALLQETWWGRGRACPRSAQLEFTSVACQRFWIFPVGLALLHFGLAALEEVEGIGGFWVDVLDHGEDVQDVLLCEGGLVAAVEVVLFNQDLEGQERQEKRKH